MAVVAHLVLGLLVQKLVDQFEGVLQLAGPVHRKARPQNREQHDDE